jgi:hypothetical protein
VAASIAVARACRGDGSAGERYRNKRGTSNNLKQILAGFKPAAEAAKQGNEPAGRALTTGYIMRSLADEHHPLDKIKAPFTHLVAASQMPDGSWIDEGISRPPLEYSEISIGCADTDAVSDRRQQRPASGETSMGARGPWRPRGSWRKSAALRLMGWVWTKASRGDVHSAVREILAQQRPDGVVSSYLNTSQMLTARESPITRYTGYFGDRQQLPERRGFSTQESGQRWVLVCEDAVVSCTTKS